MLVLRSNKAYHKHGQRGYQLYKFVVLALSDWYNLCSLVSLRHLLLGKGNL